MLVFKNIPYFFIACFKCQTDSLLICCHNIHFDLYAMRTSPQFWNNRYFMCTRHMCLNIIICEMKTNDINEFLACMSRQGLCWLVTVAMLPSLVIAEGTGALKLLAKQLITAAVDTRGAEQKRTERHPDGLWTRTTQRALRDWIDLPSMISANTAQHTGGATARG